MAAKTKTKTKRTFDPAKIKSIGEELGFSERMVDQHILQLEAMIPGPHVLKAYTPRVLPGGWTDFDYFDAALDLRHNVLLSGPTGSGKTTAARAYAAYRQSPFASVEFNGAMDPAATLGGMQVNPGTGLPEFAWGELSLITMYMGVGMLDEVNFAPPRFTAAYHGVLDARQTLYITDLGRRIKKSEDTLIISAYNPRYIGTNLLNEAFTNRWAFPVEWGYDDNVEEERVGAYSPTLLNVVRRIRSEPDVQGDIGTNVMEEFIHISHRLNINAAIHLFTNRLEPEDRSIVDGVLEAEMYVIADELGCDVYDGDPAYGDDIETADEA